MALLSKHRDLFVMIGERVGNVKVPPRLTAPASGPALASA